MTTLFEEDNSDESLNINDAATISKLVTRCPLLTTDHYLVSSPKIISESRTSRYSILPASVYQTNSESYTFTSVRTEGMQNINAKLINYKVFNHLFCVEKSRDLLLTIVGAAIGVLIPVIVITCILIIATIKRFITIMLH